MGTISKLLQQCQGETENTPGSLRQLPPDLQHVILTFADQQANAARRQIAEELISSRNEIGDLAEANEELTASVDNVVAELSQALSEKATVEGRLKQVVAELTEARKETAAERRAAETARVEVAKLQLRVEALGSLESDLHDARAQYERERSNCARAEQAVAVLEVQRTQLVDQVQELKDELAGMRASSSRLETKIHELSEHLDEVRAARAVLERELAVASALGREQRATEKRGHKRRGEQASFWPGQVPDDQVSSGA